MPSPRVGNGQANENNSRVFRSVSSFGDRPQTSKIATPKQPFLQTERKATKQEVANLLRSLNMEGEIDGQTNGRLRESVGVSSKKVESCLNKMDHIDNILANSSIRSQSLRGRLLVKEIEKQDLVRPWGSFCKNNSTMFDVSDKEYYIQQDDEVHRLNSRRLEDIISSKQEEDEPLPMEGAEELLKSIRRKKSLESKLSKKSKKSKLSKEVKAPSSSPREEVRYLVCLSGEQSSHHNKLRLQRMINFETHAHHNLQGSQSLEFALPTRRCSSLLQLQANDNGEQVLEMEVRGNTLSQQEHFPLHSRIFCPLIKTSNIEDPFLSKQLQFPGHKAQKSSKQKRSKRTSPGISGKIQEGIGKPNESPGCTTFADHNQFSSGSNEKKTLINSLKSKTSPQQEISPSYPHPAYDFQKVEVQSEDSFDIIDNEIKNAVKEPVIPFCEPNLTPSKNEEATPDPVMSKEDTNFGFQLAQNDQSPNIIRKPQMPSTADRVRNAEDTGVIDNSFCGYSIASHTDLNHKLPGIQERDLQPSDFLKNKRAAQTTPQQPINQVEDLDLTAVSDPGLGQASNSSYRNQPKQSEQPEKPPSQAFESAKPASSFLPYDVNPAPASFPGSQQQPVVMSLANLSHHQFKAMDQEHQRRQYANLVLQHQKAQAQAHSQPEQPEQLEQAQEQPKPEEEAEEPRPANPFVKAHEVQQFQQFQESSKEEIYLIEYQQFQQFQQIKQLQQQNQGGGEDPVALQQHIPVSHPANLMPGSTGGYMNQCQFDWQMVYQYQNQMNNIGVMMPFPSSRHSSSRYSQASQSDTQSRLSQYTNGTNQTNQTNLTSQTNQSNRPQQMTAGRQNPMMQQMSGQYGYLMGHYQQQQQFINQGESMSSNLAGGGLDQSILSLNQSQMSAVSAMSSCSSSLGSQSISQSSSNMSRYSNKKPDLQQSELSASHKKGLSDFNQIYKQLPSEQDKRRFLIQNAFALSQHHNGCRRLQKKFEEEMQKGNLQFCEEMLTMLIDSFAILMTDPFANYLCQKLIKVAKPDQINTIMYIIQNDFVRIATDQHGTRPLQKLLQKLYPMSPERSKLLSNSIKNNIYELSVNIHGNHVVQACLNLFQTEEEKEPIYQTVTENTLKLAQNKQGCCVMQYCLRTGSVQQQNRIKKEILNNVKELINDEYANYVVSEVIKCGDQDINLAIASVVCDNIVKFCNSKFSSTVVESLVVHSNRDCQALIFDKLFERPPSKKRQAPPSSLFKDIMLHQYGNYTVQTIIQKAFEFPKKKYIQFFLQVFKENHENLRKVKFGKIFINKICQMSQQQELHQRQQSGFPEGGGQFQPPHFAQFQGYSETSRSLPSKEGMASGFYLSNQGRSSSNTQMMASSSPTVSQQFARQNNNSHRGSHESGFKGKEEQKYSELSSSEHSRKVRRH